MTWNFRSIFFLLLLLGNAPSAATAYQATWKDILFWMQQKYHWDRLVIDAKVQVFDPFAQSNAPSNGTPLPSEIKERGFQQITSWEQDTQLAVEIQDFQGKLLHFYYELNGGVLSVATQSERFFSKMDFFPYHLLFLTGDIENRDFALRESGIEGNEVTLYLDEENRVFYRVGHPESKFFALIDKELLLLHSLHGAWFTEGGKEQTLKILYSQFRRYHEHPYPSVTEYFVDNLLFKRVTVTSVDAPQSLPLAKFKALAQKWNTPHHATIQVDYVQ